MTYLVKLHIFSGRPDPVWAVSEPVAQRILEAADTSPSQLFAESAAGGMALAAPARLGLGYRGFSLVRTEEDHPTDVLLEAALPEYPPEQAFVQDSPTLEATLLETGREFISPRVLAAAQRAIAAGPIAPAASDINCPPCAGASAPPYDPDYWNNDPTRLDNNNCYNYANNQATNTFAQPGRASGHEYTSFDCGNVAAAAQADGLQIMPDFAGAIPGWYVALVIWPGEDYHWYRQDQNGCWSHKPGSTPARNYDNSGNPITDPRTCDRGDYTDFCNYMATSDAVVIE